MWLNAWGVFCFANRCRQTQVAARIADHALWVDDPIEVGGGDADG
jgi:hypothetical protein